MARSDPVKVAEQVVSRLDRSDSSIQAGDLAAAWVLANGGLKGLVEALMEEVARAPVGGIVRTKIHEMMLRGLKDQTRGAGKLSEMETADVQRVLTGLIAQREAVFDAAAARGHAPAAGPAAPAGGQDPQAEAGPAAGPADGAAAAGAAAAAAHPPA